MMNPTLGETDSAANAEHHEVQHAGKHAEPDPSIPVDDESHARRDRQRRHGRQPPVADALCPPPLRQHLGHVGRGSRQQAGPEDPLNDRKREHQPVVGDDGIRRREHRQRHTADDQHPPMPDPIGVGAGERSGKRRGVRQEPEKEAGRERGATQIDDMKWRRWQQLKR
jgi:hypothetical protein